MNEMDELLSSDISKKVVEQMALGAMKKAKKYNWISEHSIVIINAMKLWFAVGIGFLAWYDSEKTAEKPIKWRFAEHKKIN